VSRLNKCLDNAGDYVEKLSYVQAIHSQCRFCKLKMLYMFKNVVSLLSGHASYFANTIRVKVMFTLEQTTKAHRGSRGIALLFFNLGARRRWVVNATPRPLYPRERPSTHCIGGWVGPKAGLGLTQPTQCRTKSQNKDG